MDVTQWTGHVVVVHGLPPSDVPSSERDSFGWSDTAPTAGVDCGGVSPGVPRLPPAHPPPPPSLPSPKPHGGTADVRDSHGGRGRVQPCVATLQCSAHRGPRSSRQPPFVENGRVPPLSPCRPRSPPLRGGPVTSVLSCTLDAWRTGGSTVRGEGARPWPGPATVVHVAGVRGPALGPVLQPQHSCNFCDWCDVMRGIMRLRVGHRLPQQRRERR